MQSKEQKQSNLQDWLQSINSMDFFNTNEILNGVLVHNIITRIAPQESIKSISNSNTTFNRVNNWNILSQQLKKFNIIISQQNKSKIINGNQQLVVEVLSQLKEYHLKKEKSSEVDITQLDTKKDPNQAKSLLELLLILIMKNFSISVKEAVALLSNESKYLAHILTKGLKGQFKGIQNLLFQLSKYLSKIIQFCKANQENIVFFLRSIKPALISKSKQVSMGCLHFFNKFLLFHQEEEAISIFQTHFLSTYLLAIKRHPHMEADVVLSMLQTIVQTQKTSKNVQNKREIQIDPSKTKETRGKMLKLIWNGLGSQQQKYSMLLGIIKVFGEKNKLESFMTLQFFTSQLEKSIEAIKQQKHSQICIDIVICLNEFFPMIFSAQEQNIQNQLKQDIDPQNVSQNLIENLRSLSVHTNSVSLTLKIFTLLEQFGQYKHYIAPSLYKLLLERFTELKSNDSDIYQLFLQNFTQIIKEFPSIPWQGILDAIIAKVRNSREQNHQLNEKQLEFFYFILENQNIDVKSSLIIFDLISKLFMETYHISGLAVKIIVKIVQLFGQAQQIIEELTIKLSKVCLAIHHANTKKLSIKRKSLTGNAKINDEQALMKVKNNSIEFLLRKIALLKFEDINLKLQPLVAFSYIQIKEKPEYAKPFKNILAVIGNFSEIVERYESEIKKAEQETKEKQRLEKLQKEKMSQSKIFSKLHSKHRYDTNNMDITNRQGQIFQQTGPRLTMSKPQSISMHVRPTNGSFLGITTSAQKGIQKFQKVYLSKIEKQDFYKIRQQQEQERQQMLKRIYRKKMLSNGIDIKGQSDQIQYLYEFDSKQNQIFQKHFLRIPYYTNQTQEDRDMMACEKLIKSYQKSLKLLFSIYSGQRKGQMPQNFDQIAEKNVVISPSGLCKFLKDFGFQDYISMKQIQYLTQKINIQLKPSTSDYQILQFDGFVQFIKQCSFLMFTRPPKDLRGYPLTMMLQETFSNLKLFATQNKINEQIFQQPSNIFFNETEAVSELNRKLSRNPDYILPQGYKKIVEKKITFEYGLFLEALSPTHKVVFQVLDELLLKCLGFHIIEPFTKEQKITKARPALFVTQRLRIDSMPTKHIPTSMKRQIMKFPIKSRPVAKDCAIVLDQIITAIQLGHNETGQKHMNRVEIEKKKQTQEQRRFQQEWKRKRQNRNRQAKTAIQNYKEKKQQKQKELETQKQEEQRKIREEKERKEKQAEQLKKKIQDYNKKKKEQEEQKIRKKKQQDDKDKKQRQKLKQINEETKRRIQQEKKKKQQEENAKKAEKQLEEKRQNQFNRKKFQESQLIKKKMVEEFKLRKSQIRGNSSRLDKTENKEIKNMQNAGLEQDSAE